MAALLLSIPSFAQQSEQTDSLVRLLNAESLQQITISGVNYRKAFGAPGNAVTFLHNNTYLICDTAYWNMDRKVIDAFGNVKILQNETVLTSDKLVYKIDEDLAEFRGTLVQLMDKDKNTLRTRNLDYNTKDSVAVFRNGGSMRDKDGQIIESKDGTYDSKLKLFTFMKDVNMFTDSVFVKTTRLEYESDKNLATFGYATNAWKDENMLSSNAGTYDRGVELFCFRRDVHVMTDTQEGWCDTLFFNRASQDVTMLGNVQVSDTTRNVHSLSGALEYVDSLAKVTLSRKPAVVSQVDDKEKGRDTVYFGADTIVYKTIKRCDIPDYVVEGASTRLKNVDVDPVTEFRRKAAQDAAAAAAEAAKDDPNNAAAAAERRAKLSAEKNTPREEKPKEAPEVPSAADSLATPTDSLTAPLDTLASQLDSLTTPLDTLASQLDSLSAPLDTLASQLDSLAVGADSLAVQEPKDTTKFGFLSAFHKVRIYRKDMQAVCDSLEYCDLDSLARMYVEPVIWNENIRQYIADSIYVVVKNNAMDKANLMSEAFIHIQEDSIHFDQIRGSEMVAYFDGDGALKRFDSLGGAAALFYIEENDELATVNKKESKMLSAIFKNGDIDKIYYFDTPKSDAYPIVQMSKDEQTLKGFKWQPELRPKDRTAVTPLGLRPCERETYLNYPRAKFKETEIYFPGYIAEIHAQMARRDSLQRVRRIQAREREDSLKNVAMLDSLARVDSLMKARTDSLALADSLANVEKELAKLSQAVKDTVVKADTLAKEEPVLSEKEKKAIEKAAKKAARVKAREEAAQAREKKWAEKDKRDAEKLAAKEAKKQARLRKNKLRAILQENARYAKEQQELEKYRERYLKKRAKKLMKEAKKLKKTDENED